MRSWTIAAVAILSASPLAACPPPVPGQTEAQRLKPGFDASTDIVYGVVLTDANEGQKARFKVIHVYKGNLAPGAIVEAPPSYGFDPPPCLGMTQPPPPSAGKGQYGVIAFNSRAPAFNFIDPWTLDLAFREGWIKSARP